ncbi:hypothetical protein B0H15DRAFT_1027050 [Mycena belliarum]|uniref:Uncharacterized protein n=1 Tax=Mycena belliarum TaxID=1033014 RepID=A0AAD6XF98_9AGAR|nr:hypothetical protein B0H15DRAFT_1027050 [Mycena belliae]
MPPGLAAWNTAGDAGAGLYNSNDVNTATYQRRSRLAPQQPRLLTSEPSASPAAHGRAATLASCASHANMAAAITLLAGLAHGSYSASLVHVARADPGADSTLTRRRSYTPRCPSLTSPQAPPPPSIPHIVPPAPLHSAKRTPHAAPPNDLRAAHAAAPATPRLGVHARFRVASSADASAPSAPASPPSRNLRPLNARRPLGFALLHLPPSSMPVSAPVPFAQTRIVRTVLGLRCSRPARFPCLHCVSLPCAARADSPANSWHDVYTRLGDRYRVATQSPYSTTDARYTVAARQSPLFLAIQRSTLTCSLIHPVAPFELRVELARRATPVHARTLSACPPLRHQACDL